MSENNIIYDFGKQLAYGKKWEEAVYMHLRQKPETITVIDLSENPKFQAMWIDAQWVFKNEETWIMHGTFLDVKTEFMVNKTWKIFIETNSTNTKEWCMLTTSAEYFLYYDPIGWKLYTIQIYPLRNWYKRKGIAKKHFTVQNTGYESEGITLSPEELDEIMALSSIENIATIRLDPIV